MTEEAFPDTEEGFRIREEAFPIVRKPRLTMRNWMQNEDLTDRVWANQCAWG